MMPVRVKAIAMCEKRPGEVELPLLLVADVTLILTFAFARTLALILSSPSFPGWLAPIRVEPGRLAATMNFAGTASLLWVSVALVVGGYSVASNADAAEAGKTAASTSAGFICAYVLASTAGLIPGMPLSIDQMGAVIGLAFGLATWRVSYGDNGGQ